MTENISNNAGKILLEIYLFWKENSDAPKFEKLLEISKLEEGELKRALKYCSEKYLIDLNISYGMGMKKMDGFFWIKDITAQGIDIIENSIEENGKSLFSNSEFIIKHIKQTPCSTLFKNLFVSSDGEAIPCCEDYSSLTVLGNLNTETIDEIWNGEKYNKIRNQHLQREKYKIEACKECNACF